MSPTAIFGSESFVAAIAERRVFRMFAGTEIGFSRLFGRIGLRCERRLFVRAIAERLVGAPSAAAPVNCLSRFDIDSYRRPLRNRRFHRLPLAVQITRVSSDARSSIA